MSRIAPYGKAITAAIIAGLTALLTGLDDDVVSTREWVAVAIAFVTALGVVWGVPNADPAGQHQDESVQPPNERGEASAVTILVVVALVLLILVILGRL